MLLKSLEWVIYNPLKNKRTHPPDNFTIITIWKTHIYRTPIIPDEAQRPARQVVETTGEQSLFCILHSAVSRRGSLQGSRRGIEIHYRQRTLSSGHRYYARGDPDSIFKRVPSNIWWGGGRGSWSCVSNQEGKRHIMGSFKRVELAHDVVILTCTSNIQR